MMKFFCLLLCVYISVIVPAQEIPFRTSDNVKLFVKTAGTGPVCIFIHGGPGAWSKSFEVLGGDRLEKNLRMVYYDQRGSGRSDTATDYSLERTIKDIDEIRESLHADKIFIMSHSFGGILAFNYARKYPEHVAGMILLNSTLFIYGSIRSQVAYMDSVTGQHTPIGSADNAIMNAYVTVKKVLIAKDLEYSLLSEKRHSVDEVDSVDRSFNRNRAFAQKVWGHPEYLKDYTKESAQVNVPVLVITGAKDFAIGPRHYESFHFPKQRIEKIDGGHLLYYEKNAAFVKAVTGFVNSLPK